MPVTRPVVITCAVTGGGEYNRRHPSFPVSPREIAAAVAEAAAAGAAVAHIHARDPATSRGSYEPDLFIEIVDRIRQAGTDIVINLTCGGLARFMPDPEDESRAAPGTTVAPAARRVRHIEACLPEIASLDVTTANQVDGKTDYVYLNTPRTLRAMAARFQALGVKPELEVFQAGDVLLARQLIDEGLIDGTPLMQFVLGVKWGAPASVETILYMRGLLPPGAVWTALGTARDQMPTAAAASLLGGHVRVGLEDNLYLSRGVFASNGQLVERAATTLSNLGFSVASPQEARGLFGLRSPETLTAKAVA